LEKNGIRNFLSMPNLKQFLQKFCEGPICSTALKDTTAEENLIKNKADPVNIAAIKKLRASLLSIPSRLLKSELTRLHHLSEAEEHLWNSFEKADIYEFLTGKKDTIPEFQFNWISPEAPAIPRYTLPFQFNLWHLLQHLYQLFNIHIHID